MFLKDFPIHCYVIVHASDSRTLFCDLAYVHRVHVLGHLEAKWHPDKLVMIQVGVEGCQVGRLMIKVY